MTARFYPLIQKVITNLLSRTIDLRLDRYLFYHSAQASIKTLTIEVKIALHRVFLR